MTRFITRLLWLVVLGIAFPAHAVDDSESFSEAPCPFVMPIGVTEGRNVVCGFVTVPEDRTNLDSTPIQIAVAVFKATLANPSPTPLIYLDGGPGGRTLFTLSLAAYDLYVRPFISERDVILFDQRGISYSQPSLNCPELDTLFYSTLADPPSEDDNRASEAEATCRQRLLESGVNLNAYNSTENAADVDAIRAALGYEQMDLWGISYGTYLAQYVMRQFPDTTRSVVLDAVLPVSADAMELAPTHHERALKTLFDNCAANQLCNRAYPDLEAAYYVSVDRLNANPIIVPEVFEPISGTYHSVYVDGDTWLSLLFAQLYSTGYIPFLPYQIYSLYEARTEAEAITLLRDPLAFLIITPNVSSEGMSNSVRCNDIVPFNDVADFDQNVAVLTAPQLIDYYSDPDRGNLVSTLDGCATWLEANESSAANLPVVSDIPTLIFSGEYDPITPPSWGEEVHANLANSYEYTFQGHGHGVTVESLCAVVMMRKFLNDPQTVPDNPCFEEIPEPFWYISLLDF